MIHVFKNFLSQSDAEYLSNDIKSMNPTWWSTAYKFNDEDVVYASDNLYDIENRKYYDKQLSNSMSDGYFSYRFKRTTEHVEGCDCFECVFTEKAINGFMKEFIEEKLGYGNASPTETFVSCYGEGDFLSMHADKQKGGCAFVLNLTENWRPEYGGLLHVKDHESGHYIAIVPEFNSLMVMELGEDGLDHFVSEVSKHAPNSRIAISGWYAEEGNLDESSN